MKDHSDSEKRNQLAPFFFSMGYSFQLAAWDLLLFYMHNIIDRVAHTMAYVIPVVEHWLA